MNTLAASGTSPGAVIGTILFWIGLFAAYWAPSITAWIRHVPNKGSVTVINFFAFVLFIPWIVALAMACRTVPDAPAPTR